MPTQSNKLQFNVKFLVWTLSIFLLLAGIISPVAQVQAEPLSQLTCNSITPITMSHDVHGTGEKPQSKTWTYAGEWWAVFPAGTPEVNSAGSWLWKLDQSGTPFWTPILQLSSNTNTRADAKVDGSVVHILLFDVNNTELVSVEYSGNTYQLWSARTSPSDISLGGSEVATIDVDSTGRMWLSTETSNSIVVYYSDSPYSSWSSAITVSDSNIASDDISVVVAMPSNQIGVFWSNQGNDQFLFRLHNDGDAPNTWQDVEEAAAGSNLADDHMNVAVAADGTLYAAVKTSGGALMRLLVRRPNGNWDDDYVVDSNGTRPIVQLNEVANTLAVIFPTRTGDGGDIVYRESAADNISFGSRQTLQSGKLNDPSGMKENFDNELVVVFFDRTTDKIHGEFCQGADPGPRADLAVTKVDATDPINVGNDETYTVTVTNNGPDTAENVVVTDELPPSVSFVSATPDNGGSCSHSNGTVSCDLGNMADSETVEVSIVATTTQAGSITNNVTVASDATDLVSGNNSDSEETAVLGPPTADFSADQTSGLTPLAVQFSDLSTGSPTGWLWDFGDGNSSTEQNPSHSYNTAGIYTVMLTASNGLGNDSETKVDYITVTDPPPPTADFSADLTAGVVPHAVQFTDLSTGSPTSWLWDFGDGNGSTEQNPSHTYQSIGTYTVSLTATNSQGSDDETKTDYIIVALAPSEQTFTPIADAQVKSSSATTNYGALDEMRTRSGSPEYASFVKFNVTGLGGAISKATLRLYVTDGGNDSGTVFLTTTAWEEGTITYNNAPAFDGTEIGGLGATATNSWVEIDVTGFVTGEGVWSFGLRPNDSNSTIFDTKEATNPPELVLETVTSPPDVPDIAVSPATLGQGQAPDIQATESFTIANDGDAALNWSIAEDETAVCASASEIGWASLSANNGITAVSDSDQVDVTFDSTGLADGTYTGDLCIQSDDPDSPLVQLSLTLDVCTPASPVSITDITINGNTNTVMWTGTATEHFEVWWGADNPYFAVGSDCAAAANCSIVAANENSFVHNVADNSQNYTYILLASNVCGADVVSSADSNVRSEFSFAVFPGN